MEVPIHQRYMLTIKEASKYFRLGIKWLRTFAEYHPEIAVSYGNKWMIIRVEMEQYLNNLPLNEKGERRLEVWQ